MANILTENFDGVTAPATPASISVDSGIDTSTVFSVSTPNSLRRTGSTAAAYFQTASWTGGPDGNVQLTVANRWSASTAGGVSMNSLEHSVSMLGGTGTCYSVNWNMGAVTNMYAWSAGTPSSIGTIDTTSALGTTNTYTTVLRRRFDRNSDSWIDTTIQRSSDSQYFSVFGGVAGWDAGHSCAIQVNNNAIAAGAHKAGGAYVCASSGNSIYQDDFISQSVPAIGWHGDGDSNMAGHGASSPWVYGLEGDLSLGICNHGVGGYQCIDAGGEVYTRKNHRQLIAVGVNDWTKQGYGPSTNTAISATKVAYFKSALMAQICRAGLTTITKAQAMTKTGSWTDANSGSAPNAPYDLVTSRFASDATSSKLSATCNGGSSGTYFFAFSGMDDTYTGTFECKVNGVQVATGTSGTPGIKALAFTNKIYYCPQIIVVTGAATGSNTVDFKLTNSGGNNVSICDWVAGIGDQTSFNTVFVGNLNYLSAAGYTTYGCGNTTTDASNIDTMNTNISSAVSTLAGYGLDVHLVDLNTSFNTGTMLQSDGIHYNNTGHAFIESAFNTAMTSNLIDFNAASNSADVAAASSYTGFAYWAGTNRMLAIDVSMLGVGVTVSSMTYGGANCTLVGVKSTVTSFGRVECWRICSSDSGAPVAGANTLIVTLSGSLEFTVEWASYVSVHQTTPTEAFNSAQATNAGSATDASVAITTVADNDWVHAAVVANDTSITAGNTSRNNISGTLGSGANEDNGAAKTPAGSVTMSYSGMGITATWAIAGYGVRNLAAPSGSAGAVGIDIAVSPVGNSTNAQPATSSIAIAVAGVGSSSGGGNAGAVGVNIAVAGTGVSTNQQSGAVGINIDVSGVAQANQTITATGAVGLGIGVLGSSDTGSSDGGGIALSKKEVTFARKKAREARKAQEAAWDQAAKDKADLHQQIMKTLHPEKILGIGKVEKPEDDDDEADIEMLLLYG